MKRYILIFIAVIMLVLTGCSDKYNEDDFIGKRSDEIVATYGAFDCVLGIDVPDEDGIYRDCSCGYIIEEPSTGFLGSSEEVLLYIEFDEDGFAIECREGYRAGG